MFHNGVLDLTYIFFMERYTFFVFYKSAYFCGVSYIGSAGSIRLNQGSLKFEALAP